MLKRRSIPLSLLLLTPFLASGAGSQGSPDANASHGSLTAQEATGAAADAQMRVNDAIPIAGKMKADPHASELLTKAKGVVIVKPLLDAMPPPQAPQP